MIDLKQWMLTSVAAEYARQGFADADIYYVAENEGIPKEYLNTRFPDKKELLLTLIEEIAKEHNRYQLKTVKGTHSVRERLVHLIAANLEFAEQNVCLSQVIVNGLFSTDTKIRDHVYKVYETFFEQMLVDLEEVKIIRKRTNALLGDLTTIMLSVIFTGGCPQLRMEYLSWIDYYRIANSVLDALEIRYQSNNIEANLL